jgi:hypothetical protein
VFYNILEDTAFVGECVSLVLLMVNDPVVSHMLDEDDIFDSLIIIQPPHVMRV